MMGMVVPVPVMLPLWMAVLLASTPSLVVHAAASTATRTTRPAFATTTLHHHHHLRYARHSSSVIPTLSSSLSSSLVQRQGQENVQSLRQLRHWPPSRLLRTRLWDSTTGNTNTNANSDATATTGSGSSSLVTSSNGVPTQLLSAFTNLGVSDQYDAVLTGLCAKILDSTTSVATKGSVANDDTDDGTSFTTNAATEAAATAVTVVTLQDCLDLLQEMNSQRIAASPRSLMALVDSTVKAQDAAVMANVMSQCIRNSQGIRQYGTQQTDLIPFPVSYTTRVTCPNGKKTIVERLESLPPVPLDDRGTDIASAGAFAVAVASCEVTNLVTSVDDSLVHWAASAALTLLVTVTAVDNGYDVLRTASNFLVSQVGQQHKAASPTDGSSGTKQTMAATMASTVSTWKLPDKDQLPFGLGTGQITGSVVRGFVRLTTVDPEREAECEAAALYTAYVLGLPCYAFRPNALEASVLVVESNDTSSSSSSSKALDNLLSPSGVLRMLVWLMAAPAMESMKHAQLIMSEPREAQGFLQRLEDYYQRSGSGGGSGSSRTEPNDLAAVDLFWMDDTIKAKTGDSRTVRDDLLHWAYTEADLLLRANRNVVNELSIRLSSGAATIGDCVAVIEKW